MDAAVVLRRRKLQPALRHAQDVNLALPCLAMPSQLKSIFEEGLHHHHHLASRRSTVGLCLDFISIGSQPFGPAGDSVLWKVVRVADEIHYRVVPDVQTTSRHRGEIDSWAGDF